MGSYFSWVFELRIFGLLRMNLRAGNSAKEKGQYSG